MISTEIREKQEPLVYLDAVNFRVGINSVDKRLNPKKKPSKIVLDSAHLKSYSYSPRSGVLYFAPRAGCSGSTNGKKLYYGYSGKKYESRNRREKQKGIRNQLTLADKRQIINELEAFQHPCYFQLNLLYSLVENIIQNMFDCTGGTGSLLPLQILKLEFYIEIAYKGRVDAFRDKIQQVVSEILGDTAKLLVLPDKDIGFSNNRWQAKIRVNNIDMDVEIKAYNKGDFVRIELVYNSPKIKDIGDNFVTLKQQIHALCEAAINQLHILNSKLSITTSARTEKDLIKLISYCPSLIKSKQLVECINNLKSQYLQEGCFHVPNQAQNAGYSYFLKTLEKADFLRKEKRKLLSQNGTIDRKRGCVYFLRENVNELVDKKKKEAKALKRKKNEKLKPINQIKKLRGNSATVVTLSTIDKSSIIREAANSRERLRAQMRNLLYDSTDLSAYLSSLVKLIDGPREI